MKTAHHNYVVNNRDKPTLVGYATLLLCLVCIAARGVGDERTITRNEIVEIVNKCIKKAGDEERGDEDDPFIIDDKKEAVNLLNNVNVSAMAAKVLPEQKRIKEHYASLIMNQVAMVYPYYDDVDFTHLIVKQGLYNVLFVLRHIEQIPPISTQRYNAITDSIESVLEKMRRVLIHDLGDIINQEKINRHVHFINETVTLKAKNRFSESFKKPLSQETADRIVKKLRTTLHDSKEQIRRKIRQYQKYNNDSTQHSNDTRGNNRGIKPTRILTKLTDMVIEQIATETKNENLSVEMREKLVPGYAALMKKISKRTEKLGNMRREYLMKKRRSRNKQRDIAPAMDSDAFNAEYEKALKELGIEEGDDKTTGPAPADNTDEKPDPIRRQDPRQPSGFNYAN